LEVQPQTGGASFLSARGEAGEVMVAKRMASRREVLVGLAAGAVATRSLVARAKPLKLEKEQIKVGFIKLTDMVPLAVAYEKGYFEDEGLYVTLEPQANWKVLLDRVIDGELDAAHMLAGQPLGATIGIGTQADIITAYSMDLNGNAITVSNAVWQQMLPHIPKTAQGGPVRPVKASALKPVISAFKSQGKPFRMGMVFPVSTHNYELRYWLAAGGINPGYYSPSDVTGQIKADVLLSVTPPPQMPATMEAGTINGYCVGEPWNQQALFKKVGVPVVTDYEIWKNNPEKVIGVTSAWADKNPNTHLAMIKALIRAAQWLDASIANRKEAVALISRSQYVGADAAVIGNSMTGTFEYMPGEKHAVPDFNVFYRYFATYPFYSDAIWYLTQMRRWGQIADARPDSWYLETARKVYRPDIYLQAARLLLEEGRIRREDVPWTSDGFKAPTSEFIDGIKYDGHKPNAYIDSLSIGLKGHQKVEGADVVGK
jgi:nitrate/nitrite transport system substrate-binding protein